MRPCYPHASDLTNRHIATRADVKDGSTAGRGVKELSINARYGLEFDNAKMQGGLKPVFKDTGRQYINHRAFALYIDGRLYNFNNRDHRQAMLKYALINGRQWSIIVKGSTLQLTISQVRTLFDGLSVHVKYSDFSLKAFNILNERINQNLDN